MSYGKQGFASGDVLYATQLNAMDDQIADNEEEITGLKSALRDTTENIFDADPLKMADGVVYSNGEYIATALALRTAFGWKGKHYDIPGLEQDTQYMFSLYAYTEANVDSNGLQISFVYSDDSSNVGISIKNNVQDWLFKAYVIPAGKTLKHITFTYGNEGSAVWHIKEIRMIKGTYLDTRYIQHFTACDYVNRENTESISAIIENDHEYIKKYTVSSGASRAYIELGQTNNVYKIYHDDAVDVYVEAYDNPDYTGAYTFSSGYLPSGIKYFIGSNDWYYRIVYRISSGNISDSQALNCYVEAPSLIAESRISDISEELNDLEDIVDNKLSESDVSTLFGAITEKSDNVLNPYNIISNHYYRHGNTSPVESNYFDVVPITVPNEKKVVVTCSLDSDVTRQYVRSCRYMVIEDLNGNEVAYSDSDTQSAVYSNTTGSDVIAWFTLYGKNHGSKTATKYMAVLFDTDTPSSSYITPYIEYGYTLKNPPDIFSSDFLVSPKIESFFDEEVTDTVNKVLKFTEKPNLSFAFITDTHILPGNETSVKQTNSTFANLKNVLDRVHISGVVHGGDYMQTRWGGESQDDTNIYLNYLRAMMLKASDHVYAINGNHDGISGAPPLTTAYGALLSHNEHYVTRENDNPYFYMDDEKTKVRTIFLSNPLLGSYGIPQVELNWCENVLDTVPTGYNVLLFSHIETACSDFTNNKQAFCDLLNSWHNHTGKYSDVTGRVIAYIAGHRHFDWIVPSSSSGLGFPVLVTTCSKCSSGTPSQADANAGAIKVTRTAGTVTQDSWSVFVYRPDVGEKGTLYMVRFGAGEDYSIDLAEWNVAI